MAGYEQTNSYRREACTVCGRKRGVTIHRVFGEVWCCTDCFTWMAQRNYLERKVNGMTLLEFAAENGHLLDEATSRKKERRQTQRVNNTETKEVQEIRTPSSIWSIRRN